MDDEKTTLNEEPTEADLKIQNNMATASLLLFIFGLVSLIAYPVAAFVMFIGGVFYGDLLHISKKEYSFKRFCFSILCIAFLGFVILF